METATLPEFCAIPELLAEPFDGKALAEVMENAIELRKEPSLQNILLEHSKKYSWKAAMNQHKEVFSNQNLEI